MPRTGFYIVFFMFLFKLFVNLINLFGNSEIDKCLGASVVENNTRLILILCLYKTQCYEEAIVNL